MALLRTTRLTPERWQNLLEALGGRRNAVPTQFSRLRAAYCEPHRHYHDVCHLGRCLALLDATPEAVPGARAPIEAALWFHDAVYRPGAPDNEFRSAEWAWRTLKQAGVPLPVCRHIARLILATRNHLADDADSALMVDIDLAILGAPPALYAEFERTVRREHPTVPEALFRAGRANVLNGFLQRPRIYQTRYYRLRLESRARSNLTQAIAALEEE